MKSIFLKFKDSGLLMMLVLLLCSVFGVGGAELLSADATATAGGGLLISTPPLRLERRTIARRI